MFLISCIRAMPELNSKNSKEPPLLTKGMAISFGFKRRVSSAPATKTQHSSSTLDNSIFSTDRNANKCGNETAKFIKFTRQNDPVKKNTDDNRKTIPRPSSLTNRTTNDLGVSSLTRKKNKDTVQKTVRFSALEPKTQKNTNTSNYTNKPKSNNNNNVLSPPASKFTLSASNLPKPQIPIHVTNLKSSKTLLNSNKQKTEQDDKNKSYDPKEIFLTSNLYRRLNVKVETNPTSTTAFKHQNIHTTSKIDFLTNRFESHKVDVDDNADKYYSLPETVNLNEPLLNKYEGSPSRTSRYTLPSTRFKSYSNKSGLPFSNHNVSQNKYELSTHIPSNIEDDSPNLDKNGFKNPHNSPQKSNRQYAHNIYPTITKYEKPPQITNLSKDHNNVRQKTFIKTELPKNFLSDTREKLLIDNNYVLSEKVEHYNWDNAGETMADDASCSFSSSDESKEKDVCDIEDDKLDKLLISGEDDELLSVPPSSLPLATKDPVFAAVAKSTDAIGNLLEDESPADSLFCSLSEENGKVDAIIIKNKAVACTSNKSSPSEEKTSPNTPTNGSLSLSDGKEFLIDDEIADQPALVFNQNTHLSHEIASMSLTNSPRKKRQNTQYGTYEHHDHTMFLKENKLNKKTSSLDTLSPCESISSDDLMMNYDNMDTSEYDDNESTEKDVVSTRFLKSRAKALDFSPKHSSSPIHHARVTEVKLFGSPKRCAQLELSDRNSIESSQIICNPEILQDVSAFKDMLTRLRGVLLEFETPPMIENGGSSQETNLPKYAEEIHNYKMENNDLRRQVLFLQGQLEDKERALVELHENKEATSLPQNISAETSNAATQTEKARSLTSSRSFMHFSHHKDELGSILR
ncbi:probable serine/threonine-protein kinase DDB_G0282963 isoform X2 [Agrilus planipennis]|uniref:Probable serine/threonine-protein kinase DDB_G0282963 isoform X2 n=1 Tax=Agrilus planipennis TaxID=224129 RepID=A0A1W4XF61_AGRPL|nr:probable serine/threonine-protein kinase DDB_G0282963 isoform X2 [Agrilus planipennis]